MTYPLPQARSPFPMAVFFISSHSSIVGFISARLTLPQSAINTPLSPLPLYPIPLFPTPSHHIPSHQLSSKNFPLFLFVPISLFAFHGGWGKGNTSHPNASPTLNPIALALAPLLAGPLPPCRSTCLYSDLQKYIHRFMSRKPQASSARNARGAKSNPSHKRLITSVRLPSWARLPRRTTNEG